MENIEFTEWFKTNKKRIIKLSNCDFNRGFELMYCQADNYKDIPEFHLMIAEANRRSSKKFFLANFIIAIVAILIALIGIMKK